MAAAKKGQGEGGGRCSSETGAWSPERPGIPAIWIIVSALPTSLWAQQRGDWALGPFLSVLKKIIKKWRIRKGGVRNWESYFYRIGVIKKKGGSSKG